jgi:hypothetical protein
LDLLLKLVTCGVLLPWKATGAEIRDYERLILLTRLAVPCIETFTASRRLN